MQGAVWCWGLEAGQRFGREAVPANGPAFVPAVEPVRIPHTEGAVAVHLGTEAACARLEQGAVCWGADAFGLVSRTAHEYGALAPVRAPITP